MAKDTEFNASKNFGVANIRTYVPLNLVLEELNYDSWRELFETHCMSFDLIWHLNGSSVASGPDDKTWKKTESLIKLWIYGTLSKPLLQTIMKRKYYAHQSWDHIEQLFRNNKESRAMELENELRTIVLCDNTMTKYCCKIQMISDLLENIDSGVSDKNLVTYMVNGLPEKFDNTAEITTYKVSIPTFLEARSMLLLAETRIQNCINIPTTAHDVHSSSNSILYKNASSSGSHNRNRGNNRILNYTWQTGRDGSGWVKDQMGLGQNVSLVEMGQN
ncbi:uncharacterized protein [Rutidosis leptorrhynchoides]|uniref:uncharacterized protein n=1 Tax=Rutidosis leptorrhynchoides TaxID=125765 RepID=UPI003A99219B